MIKGPRDCELDVTGLHPISFLAELSISISVQAVRDATARILEYSGKGFFFDS
jgi:hypothetical protein